MTLTMLTRAVPRAPLSLPLQGSVRNDRDDIAARDCALKRDLAALSEKDAEFWSFKDNGSREHTHAYFQYPAMMVPQMQGELIRAIARVQPTARRILDPFVGSGTILAEAMMQGMDFVGLDINPLAVLLCRAKIAPFDDEAATEQAHRLLENIQNDKCEKVQVAFKGRDKWFRSDVQIGLSRVQRQIRCVENVEMRRFFWVALAETIRLSSNSRTSTYKLHTRPADEISSRCIDVPSSFQAILTRNVENMGKQKAILAENDWLESGRYKGNIQIGLGDTRTDLAQGSNAVQSDILVTSPPYGDNPTTVPYGQHSYLPLQWIDKDDVDPQFDDSFLESTHEIDSRSLGGRRKNALIECTSLFEMSPTFRTTLELLKDEPVDRRSRLAGFCRDLEKCIDPILSQLRPNSYMVWTLGNRKVGGRIVPLDIILGEFMEARSATKVASIDRKILSKRMASKNKFAATMNAETLLVFRKASADAAHGT